MFASLYLRAVHLVRSERNAGSGPAEDDALIGLTARNRLGDAAPDVRPLLITAAGRPKHGDQLVAARAQVFEHEVRQIGSVVGPGGDAHRL